MATKSSSDSKLGEIIPLTPESLPLIHSKNAEYQVVNTKEANVCYTKSGKHFAILLLLQLMSIVVPNNFLPREKLL